MEDNKPMTPSDLRSVAQQLIRSGQMPTPEQFSEAMGKAREDYTPKVKKIREQATK